MEVEIQAPQGMRPTWHGEIFQIPFTILNLEQAAVNVRYLSAVVGQAEGHPMQLQVDRTGSHYGIFIIPVRHIISVV